MQIVAGTEEPEGAEKRMGIVSQYQYIADMHRRASHLLFLLRQRVDQTPVAGFCTEYRAVRPLEKPLSANPLHPGRRA